MGVSEKEAKRYTFEIIRAAVCPVKDSIGLRIIPIHGGSELHSKCHPAG